MKIQINRKTLSAIMFYTGVLYIYSLFKIANQRKMPVVFTGHRVVKNAEGDLIDKMSIMSGQGITQYQLLARLKLIQRVYRAGDPKDLGIGVPKNNHFYLTFDDGYQDNIDVAQPVLQKLNIKAIIFVVSDILKQTNINPWWDRYGEEELSSGADKSNAVNNYMRRCQKKKIITRGLRRDDESSFHSGINKYFGIEQLDSTDSMFYFANHTATHANLTTLTKQEIKSELLECHDFISRHERFIPVVAYPFGAYNDNVIDIVKNIPGVKMAFATGSGSLSDKYSYRRINLNTNPYYMFYADMVGIFELLSKIRKVLTFSSE